MPAIMPAILPSVRTQVLQYTTTFQGVENPISEGGAWVKPVPSVWTNSVQKNNGIAYDGGTATGTNDAVAYLSNTAWDTHPAQEVLVTVNVSGAIGSGECEILLRGHWNSTQLFTYELDMLGSSVLPVKWLGTQGSFIQLGYINGTTGGYVGSVAPSTGDQFRARITDDGTTATISMWQRPISTGIETLILQATDVNSGSTPFYTTGRPGIGFDNGTNIFAFKAFTATAL